MPTINKRFLLKLLIVLAVCTGGLFAAHAVQSRRIPAALLQQAERAADAGKTDQAIHYLRQYLEFHPDDVEAQVKLAGLLTKRNPTARGYTELLFLYEKILRLDPERDEIRREALLISLRMGRFNDAVTHAEALIKKFPNEPLLWQQLGAAQVGLQRLADARRSYEAAVARAPHDIVNYQRLAQLLWKNLDDTPGARVVLDRMVAALPQEPEVYLVRARFDTFTADYSGTAPGGGDLTRAAADLQRVFELDPENAEASLLLAEIMQRRGNVAAAHVLLRDATALNPKNLKLIRALSWLELVRGNTAAAITVLEDGLKARPDSFDLLVPLADLLVQHGDTARTAEILQRLEARKAPATQIKYLKARVAMREARWTDAVSQLESLRAESGKLPALQLQLNVLLAACYQRLGDPVAEEKAYQRVTNADPKHVPARVGLGNLYLNTGRFEDAAREFETAVQSPYSSGAVAAQWVRLKVRLLRDAPAAEWRKLELATDALAARFGAGSVEVLILRAEILSAQGRFRDAVQLLRTEAVRRPGDAHLWAVLALTTADLAGTAAGLAVVDEAQAATGDCVDVRLARAALYAREPGRIRPIGPLAERIDGWPENEQIRLLAGLVEVYDRLDDRVNVVRTLRRIVAHQPSNAAMWLKLHERAEPGSEDALHARAALVRLEGEAGASVLLCDARAATTANAAQIAVRLMQTFGHSPTRADACLALAHTKRLAGDPSAAGTFTERAFTLEPTNYETAEALLLHLTHSGAQSRAGELLARLATDPRWGGEPFRRVVGRVLAAIPPDAAKALFARCRPLSDRDPGGFAWCAERAAALQLPEAGALFEEATTRATATADDWLRLALFVSKERADAGPAVLVAAKAKLAPTAFFPLVAVYADTPAGSTFIPDAATPGEKRLLAQARLAVKLSRSKPADAGKVLEAFLTEKDVKPADADWARRNLAMIYAVNGTPEGRTKAMELLKDVSVDANATADELRATANIQAMLARYLEGEDRRAVLKKAVTALEAAYKLTKSPKDLFTLTQLHRAAGDRKQSRVCFRQLLADDPNNMYYLIAALDELVDDGEFAAAAAFAAKLMSLHANDFRALAAVARYECKAGRPERGFAVAESYVRAADVAAGDYLIRSARVAELLDELSRLPNVRGTPIARRMTDAAVERFTAVVASRPEAVVGVTGVLAADGRATEAFDQLERLGRYLPARVRASAGLAIVRGGEVTERQADLVRQWLDVCLTEEPESVTLLLNKAEFLAHRHDIAGAAVLYEKVLANDPRNVVALNNLAWLKATDPKTAERAAELVTAATRENGLTGELLDTRARIRITLRQFEAAERDLVEALTSDPTALRWYHAAVFRMSQSPPNPAEAAKAFAEAKRRGLTARSVHPADLPMYRVLEAGYKPSPK